MAGSATVTGKQHYTGGVIGHPQTLAPEAAPAVVIGPYADLTALQAATAGSVSVGAIALVGTSSPYTQYIFDGVAWVAGGGGSTPTGARLRQVSTRTGIPNQFNPAVTASMNVVAHVARDGITALQFRHPNWYVDPATFIETPTGGVMTISTAIEYPAGVFTQAPYGGADTGTAASGDDILTDMTPIVIPKGATFYERVWQSNPAGIAYQGLSTPVRPGDKNRNNSSQSNQTMDGAFSTVANGSIYCATAVLAMTAVKAAFLLGDSLVYGSQDTGDASTDTGFFARAIGGTVPYVQCGVSGDSAVKFLASNAKRLLLAQYCDVVFCDYGTNDIWGSGRTSTQVIADLVAIRNLFPTPRFYQATILPRGTSSTDSWVTLAAQTVSSTNNANRARLNNLIRGSGIPLANGYIAAAEAVESPHNAAGVPTPNSCLWKDMGVLRTTTGDGNITSGTNSYSSVTGAFTTADTGNLIQIAGAGAAGASLLAMMTFVNGNTVTLTDATGQGVARNASTTVTTANAQIGVLPLTVDGVHPFKWGYAMDAQAIRSIASLVG